MKHLFLFSLLLLMLPLHAANIAFFNDYSVNLASLKTLKAEIREEHTLYSAKSIAEFEALFSLHPDIDVAILALQDSTHTLDEFPHFKAFVENGGKVIFTDGSRSDSWEKFFGFTYTGNTNASIVNFTNTYFEALIGEAYQELHNPGYHVFSMGLGDKGVILATFANGDAASLMLYGQVIVNGFMLDTDRAVERVATRSLPRATSGSILMAQINYLQNPPPSITPPITPPITLPVYGIPLDQKGMLLFAFLSLFGSVMMLISRARQDI